MPLYFALHYIILQCISMAQRSSVDRQLPLFPFSVTKWFAANRPARSFAKWISFPINRVNHKLSVPINVTVPCVEHATIDVTEELGNDV